MHIFLLVNVLLNKKTHFDLDVVHVSSLVLSNPNISSRKGLGQMLQIS